MRTTVRLDEHLLTEAKKFASETGRTLTSVIEDALRESLTRHKPQQRRQAVNLPVWKGKGKGLRPGVNLDDTAALLDIVDGLDAPD